MKEDDYEGYCDVYKEIAEQFGVDVAKQFYNRYRGITISFPMNLYAKNYIVDCINKEYDGTNAKELARKYGYTLNWIKHLVKEYEKKAGRKK